MKTRKLKGRLRISRPTQNHCDDYVSISLTDSLSLIECVEIEVPLEEFANALFSREAKCEFELRPKYVGMKYECKTEQVRFKRPSTFEDLRSAKKAVAAFEKDGWIGRFDDTQNHHKVKYDGDYLIATVVFTRHVPVEGTES